MGSRLPSTKVSFMEVAMPQRSPRRPGDMTRIGDLLPAPDMDARPADGACQDCGVATEPVWLPTAVSGNWHLPSLCPACAEARRQERESRERREREQQRLQDRIRRAGLASPYRASRRFETFRQVAGTEQALAAAQAFAVAMGQEPRPHKGLLLVGSHQQEPNGCGKTHLALAILHQVFEANPARAVLFVEFADYLGALKRSFSNDRAEGNTDWVRGAMFSVDLLVLDDIGAAANSRGGWDTEEMCRLLNHRIECGLPIVATVDLGPEEMRERLGGRVVSRLYEACEMVPIKAGDYRKRVLRGGVDG